MPIWSLAPLLAVCIWWILLSLWLWLSLLFNHLPHSPSISIYASLQYITSWDSMQFMFARQTTDLVHLHIQWVEVVGCTPTHRTTTQHTQHTLGHLLCGCSLGGWGWWRVAFLFWTETIIIISIISICHRYEHTAKNSDYIATKGMSRDLWSCTEGGYT